MASALGRQSAGKVLGPLLLTNWTSRRRVPANGYSRAWRQLRPRRKLDRSCPTTQTRPGWPAGPWQLGAQLAEVLCWGTGASRVVALTRLAGRRSQLVAGLRSQGCAQLVPRDRRPWPDKQTRSPDRKITIRSDYIRLSIFLDISIGYAPILQCRVRRRGLRSAQSTDLPRPPASERHLRWRAPALALPGRHLLLLRRWPALRLPQT